jgi:CRP/FNR family cyclic AMP-dependent transcriptional regulator
MQTTSRHIESSDRNADHRKLFVELDSHTTAKMVDLGIEAWFDPGQIIFRERDQSGQFYLITHGSVALEQPGESRAIRIQTLHEGDFLGWSALLGEGTRHFQARALTGVGAITFDGGLLRTTCENDSSFGYALMKRLLLLVTERLDATRSQVAGFQRAHERE